LHVRSLVQKKLSKKTRQAIQGADSMKVSRHADSAFGPGGYLRADSTAACPILIPREWLLCLWLLQSGLLAASSWGLANWPVVMFSQVESHSWGWSQACQGLELSQMHSWGLSKFRECVGCVVVV